MSALAWYVGQTKPVDPHPSVVRSTLDTDETMRRGPAEIPDAPEFNEVETDKDPALVGLSPRQMSGDVQESKQYVPFWTALASVDRTKIIDEQVASSGTAAQRETAGSQGHGTMEFTKSIEPVIREGGAYGNDYFVRDAALIQDGAGAYMSSPVPDVDWQGVSQVVGTRNSRAAYSGLYQSLLGS